MNKTRFTVCDFTNVDGQDYSMILHELIEKFNSVSVGLKSQMKIYSALIPGKIYHSNCTCLCLMACKKEINRNLQKLALRFKV